MSSTKEKEESKDIKEKKQLPERSSWNALLVTLWVSRWFGVAPVRFDKNVPGVPVTVSNTLSTYSKVLNIFIHAVLLAGMVMDLQEGKQGIRLRGNWARFAFISEVILLITINCVGAFGAKERLMRSIDYLNVIDKVKSNIERPGNRKSSKIGLIMTIGYMVISVILNSVDYYTFYVDNYKEGRNYTLMYYYVCFYLELMIVMFLELQFMWVATCAHSGLKTVNNNMEDLIYLVDLQRSSKSMSVQDLLDVGTSHIPLTVKPINALVDNMAKSQSKHTARADTSKYILESIRRLSISYGTVCDVIAGINNSYGALLMLLIVSFVLHFVVTPFYLLNYWYSDKPRIMNLIVQMFFVCYHFTHLMLAVEPGYQIEKENEYTQTLTRQLMQRTSSDQEQMLDELDLMMKHIALHKVYYSPMGFCKLTRSLIKVILGGATTYLVIILQFQRMVAGDW